SWPLPEAVQAGAGAAADDRGGRDPAARRRPGRGGDPGAARGRRPRERVPARGDADLDLRRRLNETGAERVRDNVLLGLAVPLPDEAEAVEGEKRLHRRDRAGVRGDQLGETAGGDDLRLHSELPADRVCDAVDLA